MFVVIEQITRTGVDYTFPYTNAYICGAEDDEDLAKDKIELEAKKAFKEELHRPDSITHYSIGEIGATLELSANGVTERREWWYQEVKKG